MSSAAGSTTAATARRSRCPRPGRSPPRTRRRWSPTCGGSSTSAPSARGDLVERFGADEVLDAIDRDPAAAFAARRPARHARAQEAAESWQRAAGHPAAAPAARARTGSPTWPRGSTSTTGRAPTSWCARNPYELTSVFGVGFAIADRIAPGRRAPRRCREPARARGDHARALGVRAQRLEPALPCRRCSQRRARAARRATRRPRRRSTSWSPAAQAVARGGVGLPRGDRRARGRARRAGRRAGRGDPSERLAATEARATPRRAHRRAAGRRCGRPSPTGCR